MVEDAHCMLLEALDAKASIDLCLHDIAAQDVLSLLAKDGSSFHVRIVSLASIIELEIGNGIVMGARAHRDGEVREGRAAYVLLRSVQEGAIQIEPKRFLSMANILEPIHALPDLTKPNSAPPPAIEADTVEVPRLAIDFTPVMLAEEPPTRVETPRPARKKRGLAVTAVGVALAVWGIAAGAFGAWRAADERVATEAPEPIVAGEMLRTVPAAEVAPIAQQASLEEPDASELAREARYYLRNGRHRAALERAREAARMRRYQPYYQTLLGDALEANGREEEARRVWRRAARLRGGYQPALDRLASS